MGCAMSAHRSSRTHRRQKLISLKKKARQVWRFAKKKLQILGLKNLSGKKMWTERTVPTSRTQDSCSDMNAYPLEEEIEPPTGHWSLIPGLPHDVAVQCLARVARVDQPVLRAVCKTWRWLVQTKEFAEQRKYLGCAEDWLYLHVGTSPHLDERREGKRSSNPKWQLVGGFSLWHALDPYNYKWHALPPVPYNKSVTGGQVVLGATSVVMNGNLYVIGGAPFGKAAIRDVWVYNPLRNMWRRAASMTTPRFACLAATIKGKLYVIGGTGICHLTSYSLPCLEVYNPKTNTWSYKASARGVITTHPGNSLKYVAVIDDKLCVIGAQNVKGRTNAGMYDPESDTWCDIRPGLREGWGKASTVMDGLLYTLDFGSYQQYVPSRDRWLTVQGKNADSLLEWDPRLVSAMAGSNGKLYMVGTMGPALIVVIAPVKGGRVNQNVCWHTMKLPNGVDFLGDLGHCSCQVITF